MGRKPKRKEEKVVRENVVKEETPQAAIIPAVEEKPVVVSPHNNNELKRIKVTPEELAQLQVDKKLVGYDPATKEAIIR